MFRDRNLLLLAAGQFASRLGDASFHIALIWFALEITGSTAKTGLVITMEFLPIVLFGVFAGVAVDRFDRRRMMLGASLFRAGLMLGIPVAFLLGYRGLAVAVAAAFGLAMAMSLFTPARDALVPSLVRERRDRVSANALVQVSDQFAWLIGPLVYPLLIPVLGLHVSFGGLALLFFLSWLALRLMRRPAGIQERKEPETPAYSGEAGITAPAPTGQAEIAPAARVGQAGIAATARAAWSETKAGFQLFQERRELRWLVLITAVNNFFIMGAALMAMPAYIKLDLGLSALHFGLVEAALAVGMIVSSTVIIRRKPVSGLGRLWLIGMIVDGLTYLPMFLAPSFAWLLPLIFFHALAIPMITIFRTSIIQNIIAPEFQGRAFAFVIMSVNGMNALAVGVTGLLLSVMPTHILFGTWGLLGMLCGLVGWLVPSLRRLA